MRTVADLVRGRGLEQLVSMRLSGARDQDVAGGFRQEFAGKATNHCSFQRATSMRAHCQNIGMEHRDLAPYRHVRAAVDQLEIAVLRREEPIETGTPWFSCRRVLVSAGSLGR